MATWQAVFRPVPLRPYGVQETAARPGRRCAMDCHRKPATSPFFGQPWRVTNTGRWGSTLGPIADQWLRASTRVRAGARLRGISRLSRASKRSIAVVKDRKRGQQIINPAVDWATTLPNIGNGTVSRAYAAPKPLKGWRPRLDSNQRPSA